MKIGICDDNLIYLNGIMLLTNNYIKKNYASEQIDLTQFSSSKELMTWVNHFGNTLDILILDIVLENNKNGIEIAKRIANLNPNIKIIFITAHIEQAADISEAPFIYFVYKNKDFEKKLYSAIDKAICSSKTENIKCIIINDEKIFLDKVECFIADKKYTIAIYNDKNEDVLKAGISSITRLLPPNFVLIHRSCIINMDYINRIIKDEKAVELISGNKVQIARAKYNTLLNSYHDYLKTRFENYDN